jgi:hypothetical protein
MLPIEARAVIRHLLSEKTNGILDSSNPLYKTFTKNQDEIREHFANSGLDLVFDEYYGIVFTKNLEGDELPQLIIPRKISVFNTAVLLVLREYFQDKTNRGESKVYIDIETIAEQVKVLTIAENSEKLYRNAIEKSVKKFVGLKILTTVKGDNERFIITPIVRHVLDAERLDEIKSGLLKLAYE